MSPPYPEGRMKHLLHVVSNAFVNCIVPLLVTIQPWADDLNDGYASLLFHLSSPYLFYFKLYFYCTSNFHLSINNRVKDQLNGILGVCTRWTTCTYTLTYNFWPNYEGHKWNGKPYPPFSSTCFILFDK